MFCSTELAAEIERAESELMARCAAAPEHLALPIGGGSATCCGADSPFTKVAGLGFAAAPTDAELSAIEAAFSERGAPVHVELSTLAPPELGERLTARGYRLVGIENVLGLALPAAPGPDVPADLVVEPAADPGAWLDVAARASIAADDEGVASHESFALGAIRTACAQLLAAGSSPYLATLAGSPAGAGSIRTAGRIAQLTGAATLPEHRRRGVQRALLGARLAAAHASGCEVAIVTTAPGSLSQRNVQRAGFSLLYARTILRSGPL